MTNDVRRNLEMTDNYPIKQFLIDHPLPWRLSQIGPTCVEAANDAYVCDGAGVSGGAFIVKSCNDYESLLAQRNELLEVLQTVPIIAREAYGEWDRDNDYRVGKILSALAGMMKSYRPDTDRIHAAIANAKGTTHA